MHATNSRLPAARRSHHAMGFSLIELLVVIAIIVVIIAITVPALASARKAAKRSETANLLTDLSQGVAQFTLDEKRQPGYFTVKEMGNVQNLTEGMSTMQNVMLDMMGGVVDKSTVPLGGTVVAVGPFTASADKIHVDYAQMGRKLATGNKLYWNLPPKVFEKTDPGTGQPLDTGLPSRIGTNKAIREIVDAFGAPILGWATDEGITKPIASVNDFALESYDDAAPLAQARTYWAQNAAFLSSTGTGTTRTYFGSRQFDQFGESMLNSDYGPGERGITLMGFLGNPGAPKNPSETNLQNMLPTGASAPLVFHSAGVDGYIFSVKDKGVADCRLVSQRPVLDYGVNVKNKTVSKFDDLIQGAN
ncbi:MAG: prepilin-type N-terminal cleavage/methylation domain-containing protein [Phycisphaerales bacterium]